MVDVRGTRLRVTEFAGSGPRVLLVHGIGASSRDFHPAIDALSTVMRPITVDLRGHGDSGRPASGYHYDDYVGDLETLIPALGLDPGPIILGHSLGGILTLFWALRHPGAAKALIIEDSPLRSGEEFRPAFEGWLMLNALTFDEVCAYYRERNPHWSAALVETRAWDITHTERAVFTELMVASMANDGLDTRGDLSTITAPTLFVHGDVDTGSMVHPDDLAHLATTMPNVELARIAHGGHSLHRSHLDAFVDLVARFVRDTG